MTPETKLFEYIKDTREINKRQGVLIKDVLEFVCSRNNWGISYKSFALTHMLASINITEAEIMKFLTENEHDTEVDISVTDRIEE